MEQQSRRACERTKSKQKQVTSYSNWPRVLLFDIAYKQCNCIIKGWLYCLTSESKGRFLLNNIFFGSTWCLVMAQIQFFLIKTIKIGRPEHSLIPNPLTYDNISFVPYPPSPLKVDIISVSTLAIFMNVLILQAFS